MHKRISKELSKKKLMGILVLGIMLGQILHASEVVKVNANFYSEITKFSVRCIQNNCETPYAKKIVYDYLSQNPIEAKLKKIFERVAYRQAQIWGDTILEGDYEAAGNTRLDRVVNLYKNRKLVGYLITYSEKAWDTSTCRYDGINESTLKDCKTGRIVESSYVSLDFKDYLYDDKNSAIFK